MAAAIAICLNILSAEGQYRGKTGLLWCNSLDKDRLMHPAADLRPGIPNMHMDWHHS